MVILLLISVPVIYAILDLTSKLITIIKYTCVLNEIGL